MPKTELACGTCHDLHDFGGSRKGIENGGQKGSKNYLKIYLLVLGGSIFEILGGFLRLFSRISKIRWLNIFATLEKNLMKT